MNQSCGVFGILDAGLNPEPLNPDPNNQIDPAREFPVAVSDKNPTLVNPY